MAISRRTFCALLVVSSMSGSGLLRAETPITVTDMAGRTVTLASRPKRIILLDAVNLLTMSLLHTNPVSLVAGWAAVARFDSDLLRQQFQQGQSIPLMGTMMADSLSVEKIINLKPDLIVTTNWLTPVGSRVTEHLQQAGIPFIYSEVLDNNIHHQINTENAFGKLAAYMAMWGTLLGAQQKASDFMGFVNERLQRVQAVTGQVAPVPVYLELKSIFEDCCWVTGQSQWGELLQYAGGKTLAGIDSPWFKKLSLEQLISLPQEVYIAVGGWGADNGGGRLPVGPGLAADKTRAALNRLIQRPGFSQLTSVRTGRVYAIWSGLLTVKPLNILFVELASKWLHPNSSAEIDPKRTLAEINSRFFATPLAGPVWVSLRH